VLEKYEERTLSFYKTFLAQDGARVTLSMALDSEGEFISESFVEQIRQITTEHIAALRKEDLRNPDRKDYWKLEFERRIKEENLQLHINQELTSNY
jgi:endo-1,4-beta-D-glucanase Y